MLKYFDFPERFKVTKSIGRERFLNTANLTPSEYKRLSIYMNQTEILYDIYFEDKSEVLVLYSDISHRKISQEYGIEYYAKAIKQSFPYKCLLILHCKGVIKLCLFDEHSNSKDANRTVVDYVYITQGFVPERDSEFEAELIEKLKSSITASKNADDLYSKWKNIFLDGGPSHYKWLDEYKAEIMDYLIEQAQDYFERKSRYELALEGNAVDKQKRKTRFEDVNSDVFEGVALDPNNEPYDGVFLDFCKANCRKLYDEACEYNYVDEEQWLMDYIDACESYAKESLNKTLDSECISDIAKVFRDETDIPDSYSFDFEYEYLKELLNQYFDC